uniref:F-box domain-containing protein n=1 Tax=Oryza nivara TaxID=4536 RepID=A0A0E0IKQ9_ORYNI
MEMMKRCSDIQVSSTRPRKAMRIAINSWSTILLRYIPEDVLFKILSWLPSKSLIRFRSVCKAWHATISSSRFVNAHLECSKQRPSLLVIPGSFEMKKNGENIAFLMSLYKYQDPNIMHLQDFPRGIRKWIRPVHCDGLLLISTRKHKMMICNPSTREIVSLPEGSHSLCGGMGLGFGFDPHSNKYKVTRAFYQRDYPTTRQVCKFEVLTLGTDAWRQTEDPPYPIDRLTPVHVKGAIYWKKKAAAGIQQGLPLQHPRNGVYQTFLKKAVMDLHLFNYADSLVAQWRLILQSAAAPAAALVTALLAVATLMSCNFKGADS